MLCVAIGEETTAIFLEAFELANSSVILSLLARKGVRGWLLIWVRDFLSGRMARVAFQGQHFQSHHHENGTPQVGILSPLLF